MLNFNQSIQEVIESQSKTRKASQFIEYGSKKQILETSTLSDEHKKFIKELKGTFSFALHTSNKYLIVTLFNSRDKKYGYMIIDLETMNCAECDSIKNAKIEIMNIINATNTTESGVEETETETAPDTKEEKVTKKSKKATNK